MNHTPSQPPSAAHHSDSAAGSDAVRRHPSSRLAAPQKDDIALMPPYPVLGLADTVVVNTAALAASALAALQGCATLGFDTESKPTFVQGEVSTGPHVLQLATATRAYVFQLHDPESRAAACALLVSPSVAKVGFGLSGDFTQILRTLGVTPRNVLDINTVFRDLGYPKEIGVKGAVAVLFGKRLLKSRKATTSNWANRELTDLQISYAANDAWAAIMVHIALVARGQLKTR